MNNSMKLAQSTAIRVEVKRHENLKSSFGKLFKQLDRVQDPQLRSGLKVYLHSVQGEWEKKKNFMQLIGDVTFISHLYAPFYYAISTVFLSFLIVKSILK